MALTYRAKLARMLNGFPEPMTKLPEAASQTFKWGDLVFMSGGYVTICGADPASIAGIAMENGHNSTAGAYDVDILFVTADTLIQMQVYHATEANNVIEATDLFKDFGIAVTSNVWYVDKADVSATRVRVVEFIDPLGTANGRVAVQVLAANRMLA